MARREKGAGSISQRKDGKWTGRLYLGHYVNGKQKVKAVYGNSKTEVKKKLKELQEEVNRYPNIDFSRITLGELLVEWQTGIKKYELKQTSYGYYKQAYNSDAATGYNEISHHRHGNTRKSSPFRGAPIKKYLRF